MPHKDSFNSFDRMTGDGGISVLSIVAVPWPAGYIKVI